MRISGVFCGRMRRADLPCHRCLHPYHHIVSSVGGSEVLATAPLLARCVSMSRVHLWHSWASLKLPSCWVMAQEYCGLRVGGRCWLVCGFALKGTRVCVGMVFDGEELAWLVFLHCLGYATLAGAAVAAASVGKSTKDRCCSWRRDYGRISSGAIGQRFAVSGGPVRAAGQLAWRGSLSLWRGAF